MEDFYYEESNTKQVIMKCLIIIFIIGFSVGTFMFYKNKNTIRLKKIVIELGGELSNDVTDYLDNEASFISDYKLYLDDVDTSKVGTYTYKVRYNKHVKTGKIVIKDTTLPEVTVDEITVGIDEKIEPMYLVTSCKDFSLPCTAVFEDEKLIDKLKIPGTYDAKIKVSDAVGNSVSVDVKIKSSEDANFSSVMTSDLEYYTNSIEDDSLKEIYFNKLDKAIHEDTLEFEKLIQTISAEDFENYTNKELSDIKLVTAYNKYMYVIGVQVLAIYADGTQELLTNEIKKGE